MCRTVLANFELSAFVMLPCWYLLNVMNFWAVDIFSTLFYISEDIYLPLTICINNIASLYNNDTDIRGYFGYV